MIYEQSTGKLFDDQGRLLGQGHAGNGAGLNNPDAEDQHNVGPLPRGQYTIGTFRDHPTLGPLSAPLTPVADRLTGFNWLHGRGQFWLHGPELSEGCLVQERPVRATVAAMADKTVTVIR